MKKFQYRFITLEKIIDINCNDLKMLGMVGWEVIFFVPGRGLLLKREISENPQKESLLDDKTTIVGGKSFKEITEEDEKCEDRNPKFICPSNIDENL